MCACSFSHSHKHTPSRKEGFFLFFSLLHPLTAAAASARRHHPGSSSFASQPEHSGRMATRRRGPSLFHESGHLCREIFEQKKSARDRPQFSSSLSFLLLGTIFTRTHTYTHPPVLLKRKSVARTPHTHAQIFPSNFVPSKRKFDVFFPSIFRKLENSIRAENPILSSRTQLSLWNCQSTRQGITRREATEP